MSGVVIVTGGSRGIGAAVVRRAAVAGWSVCFSYRTDESAAWAVAEEVRRVGRHAHPVGPVTGLVANAGIVAEKRRLDEVDADRVRRLLEVNVVAPILCCREAVRR